MIVIANLTQHPATTEQVVAGVVNLPGEPRGRLIDALTFGASDLVATEHQSVAIAARARDILALIPAGCSAAMIGGAPYLMPALQATLVAAGVDVLYAISDRVSTEAVGPDGVVRKVAEFRHVGFVRVPGDWYAAQCRAVRAAPRSCQCGSGAAADMCPGNPGLDQATPWNYCG